MEGRSTENQMGENSLINLNHYWNVRAGDCGYCLGCRHFATCPSRSIPQASLTRASRTAVWNTCLPEKITAEEFQNAQLFMTANEQKTWQDAYSDDGDILDRNDFSKKDLEQFDSDLIVPILLNYQMSMMSEDSFREMLMQQQQGNPQAAEQLKTMSIADIGRAWA